jgi:hypothetical protein
VKRAKLLRPTVWRYAAPGQLQLPVAIGPPSDTAGLSRLSPLRFGIVGSSEKADRFAERSEETPSALYRGVRSRRFDSDNRHHSIVLVLGDVAVVNEVADIRTPKIHHSVADGSG